ncbi:MAG: arsenate reductase ArsC [Phycisphaerae bacterium]|nr:arsenate reductase ArsC [Phycisphaerae bacterium]
MPEPYTVLFLCTGNSCRSQMAEALLRHLGGDRFRVISAGSHPAGFVHGLALETLQHMGVSAIGLYSKSWDEFAATPIDIVLTLCDHAAGQTCPAFPGPAVRAHWSLPDPAFVEGTDEQRLAFALQVAGRLRGWIEKLIGLPIDRFSPQQLRAELERIPRP